MLSIDGLVTGLDTTGIIDGLLAIQQRQIDTLNARRAENLGKQSAFSGLEARLLSFRGTLSRIASIQTSALEDKVVTSSDESVIQAAASDDAAVGTYRLRVNELATSHQIATTGFATAESTIGQGEHTIQVGDGDAVTIKIDNENDTLEGLANTINNADAGVTATIINDGSVNPDGSSTPYRLLLTSNSTGESSEITISTVSGDALPFVEQPVQLAQNASITIGSGDGAISIFSESNRVENVIAGVTLNLQAADENQEVTLSVSSDTETGVEAIQNFVGAYNDFMDYVNSQIEFNAETQVGGPLLGERTVVEIKDELSLALSGVVGGLGDINRMNAIGLSLTDNGKLNLDEGRLRDVLSGDVEGVTSNDVARLFALGANVSSDDFVFVVGSSDTVEGEYEIDITQLAESASVQAANAINGTVTIDESNSTFSLLVDGRSTGDLTLAAGQYTADQLAAEIQSTINASSELGNRTVSVTNDAGVLTIASDSLGSSSEITLQSGTAFSTLGFNGDESDFGEDVQGHFIVDGVIEEATGSGTTLRGKVENANTADLQIRVALNADELVDGVDGTVQVTRGLASRLDNLIGEMVDEEGEFQIIDDRFEQTNASIQETIERLQARFEAQQQSLLAEFAALEGAVGELQTTGNFLAAQFAGISGLSV